MAKRDAEEEGEETRLVRVDGASCRAQRKWQAKGESGGEDSFGWRVAIIALNAACERRTDEKWLGGRKMKHKIKLRG